jgi:hypothetical protein
MKLPLELGERHHQYRQMKFAVERQLSQTEMLLLIEDSYEPTIGRTT